MEFDLIDRLFGVRSGQAAGASLPVGIGDDCAVIRPEAGLDVLTSVDTLVEGVHFFSDAPLRSLGHKSLAVSMSDLAACGAKPLACLLSVAVPSGSQAWLTGFSEGFKALARTAECPLIGGDTTQVPNGAPKVITVTVFGTVPQGHALLRSGARAGDEVWVAGMLGGAAHAVYEKLSDPALSMQAWAMSDAAHADALQALNWPSPQYKLGQALRGLASACIDLSDGLAGDLGHILKASGVSARLDWNRLPLARALFNCPVAVQRERALHGGDDYVLCFTAAPAAHQKIAQLARNLATRLSCIGRIVPQTDSGATLSVHTSDGTEWPIPLHGYQHFS